MTFWQNKKKVIFLLFLIHLTICCWAQIYIQKLPETRIPADFPAGWYAMDGGYFFFNPAAGIYISTLTPVDNFSFDASQLTPVNNLPSSFQPVNLIPKTFEGHALTGELSIVESFEGIEPVFPGDMGLLTINLFPGHDHFQNNCNIIDLPVLKNNERLIYFIYSFAPTNLKVAVSGVLHETFTYTINDSWITYGNIHAPHTWILGTLTPSWFDESDMLRDLFFTINDHPSEYSQATHHFLIDGPYLLTEDNLETDLLAPNVELIGKSFEEILFNLPRRFYLLIIAFFAGTVFFSFKIHKLGTSFDKEVS